jgi:hypothetical protein
MTDNDLFNHALKACCAYKKIYTVFPAKVGIQYGRYRSFYKTEIYLPEMVEDVPLSALTMAILDTLKVKLRMIPIEPIVGPGVFPDEVYLPCKDGRDDQTFTGTYLLQVAQRLTRLY